MSYPFGYNSASILFPPDGLSPANYMVDIDHMFVVGATGDAAKPKWVGRAEGATNSGALAAATSTVAGHPGVITSTPGSSSGARIQQEVAHFMPSATAPIIMEAYVSFVTGGTYAVGWVEVRADQATTGTSSGLTATVQGVVGLIQSDDKLDVAAIGSGDTASTTLTDQYTFTAGTWYRIGVKTWPTYSEIYVNGKIVSQITHTTLAAQALTPFVGTWGAGATKIISIDYIGTATGVG